MAGKRPETHSVANDDREDETFDMLMGVGASPR